MRTKLQVISGALRGRRLEIPEGARPTQARARAAVMNMLAGILTDAATNWRIWDAFAGSGALGIEFASRFGAARAIFTDTDPDAIAAVKKNAAGLDAEVVIKQVSALRASFDADVIFIDPPYSDFAAGKKLVEKLAADAAPGTIIVWEMEISCHACGAGKAELASKRRLRAYETLGGEKLPHPRVASSLRSQANSFPPRFAEQEKLEILRDRTHGRARFLVLRKV